MAKYSGKGWHYQSQRHSKAAKTGIAGGKYSIYNSNWRQPKNVFNDKIKGGLADGIPDEAFTKKQLKEGTKVEMEHTNNPLIAKEIAKDHIFETGKIDKKGQYKSQYYKELKKLEQKIEN